MEGVARSNSSVVRWGRSAYSNIQKFIHFLLIVNVAVLTMNSVAACSTGHLPLTAVQLLWVNLIMATLGALALATEPPTDDIMKRTPVAQTEPMLTSIMWRNIFYQGLLQKVVRRLEGKGDLNSMRSTWKRGSCKLVLILVAVATLFGAAEAIAPEAASTRERSMQAESSESDSANFLFGVIAAIGVFFSIIGVVVGVIIAIVRQAWRPSRTETVTTTPV